MVQLSSMDLLRACSALDRSYVEILESVRKKSAPSEAYSHLHEILLGA